MRRAVPLLAAALALLPLRASRACTPAEIPFTATATWPRTDAIDVPIDGVVIVLGTGDLFTNAPEVSVSLDGVAVPGELSVSALGLYTWRAAGAFEAGATYEVEVSGLSAYTFTTGDALAPEPVASALGEVELEQHEVEIRECAKGDGCSCDRWRTLEVETHMRARVSMPAPPEPFGRFNAVEVEVAAAPDKFTGAHRLAAPWPVASELVIDFGIAGTWPSDQVCTRATVIDPLGQRAIGEPSCAPIGEVNTPAAGCACAAAGGPGDLAPLALLALVVAGGRRRRSADGRV